MGSGEPELGQSQVCPLGSLGKDGNQLNLPGGSSGGPVLENFSHLPPARTWAYHLLYEHQLQGTQLEHGRVYSVGLSEPHVPTLGILPHFDSVT